MAGAALLSLKLLASLPQLAEIPAALRHWPGTEHETGPEEGVGISKGNADEWLVDEMSMADLTAPLPCALEDAHLASTGDPSHVPTLTESIDRALADPSPVPALAALAVQLTGSVGSGLSLASIDRMVRSFRASRHWREEAATTSFMSAMLQAFGPTCMPDRHLEHLLRLWDWRYGEASLTQGDRGWDIGASLSRSIAKTVPSSLGQWSMPDSQLWLLIRTVCQEPSPSGSEPSDRVVMRHSRWAGNALLIAFQKMTLVATEPDIYDPWRAHQLKKFLHYALHVPSVDPRWKADVLQAFRDQGVTNPGTIRMASEQWNAIFMEALHSFLSPPGSNLRRYPSFATALIGLHDQMVKINQDPTLAPWRTDWPGRKGGVSFGAHSGGRNISNLG